MLLPVVICGVTFCAPAIVGLIAPDAMILPVPLLVKPTLQCVIVAVLVLVSCGNVIAATGFAVQPLVPDVTDQPVVDLFTLTRV